MNIGRAGDYRVPDLVVLRERANAVFLASAALVVEIVSPGDESWAKLGFYFGQDVEEVVIVDPTATSVSILRRDVDGFQPVAASAVLALGDHELAAEIDWPPNWPPN